MARLRQGVGDSAITADVGVSRMTVPRGRTRADASAAAARPQHGPGRKHLAGWQRMLTHAHPGALIRGLVHSDGCRSENTFRTKLPSGRIAEYTYLRYFFSNLSTDIRGIFVEHCALLGVRVTQSSHRNLSVHRDSVAILERIVGPKR